MGETTVDSIQLPVPDVEHDRLRWFLEEPHPTPFLAVDLASVAGQYGRFTAALPDVVCHYAVKANPAPAVVRSLAALGASMDVASPAEVDACLAAGAAPDALSYGNTVKKESDNRYAHARGVRLFAVDSEPEVDKVARAAPGAAVLCRLATDGRGARWPLSGKFGCDPDTAVQVLIRAARLGLEPTGVAFHVGSQQCDPRAWERPIGAAGSVFRAARAQGLPLRVLNLGGGFPVRYREEVPDIGQFAAAIRAAIDRHFGGQDEPPRLIAEPGRFLAAPAGVLRSEVVLVSGRGGVRWVYLDVGRFSGLAETDGEAIVYDLRTSRDGGPTGPVVLAGPTCDSVDVLYGAGRVRLPSDLRAGDYVDVLAAGAYTASYSSVGFNGFPPLPTICL
jgi:ornithine decarboxylase